MKLLQMLMNFSLLNMKSYTAKQAAELLGVTYHALRKQLDRDAKKPKRQRKYPGAKHCACGHMWMISEKDLNRSGK